MTPYPVTSFRGGTPASFIQATKTGDHTWLVGRNHKSSTTATLGARCHQGFALSGREE